MEAEADTLNHRIVQAWLSSSVSLMLAHTLTHLVSHAVTLSSCVLIVLNEPSQAEVGDLAHQIVSNENVSCSEITVDVVHPLNVRHSSRNLARQKELRSAAEVYSYS